MLSYGQYKLISESIAGLGNIALGFGRQQQYINNGDQDLEEAKKKMDMEADEEENTDDEGGKAPFLKDKVDVDVDDMEDMDDDKGCKGCKKMHKEGGRFGEKHGRVHKNGLRMQDTKHTSGAKSHLKYMDKDGVAEKHGRVHKNGIRMQQTKVSNKTETVEMTTEEKAFWDSLKNQMYSDLNPKYYSGLSIKEDKLIAPAGDVTGQAPDGDIEPGPGEVGYAPSARIGQLGSYSEWSQKFKS